MNKCWQCAGCGLLLPQAKSPLTVARQVIHIEPEPCEWGSGSLVLRVGGVGRRNGRLHRWERAPPRKIRCRFRECKHILLMLVCLVSEDEVG
jgi:hypothetical protein